MNLLQKIIEVTLTLDGIAPPSATRAVASRPRSPSISLIADGADLVTVVPRQPLRGKLTVAFQNADYAQDGTATAFLSQIGESSLPRAWRHLLGRLTLVPFLMDRADTDPADDDDNGTAVSFVFGVPTFWNDKLYASHDGDDDNDDEDENGDYGGGGGGNGDHSACGARASLYSGASLHPDHHHHNNPVLPCRAAGEAFEVAARTVVTPAPEVPPATEGQDAGDPTVHIPAGITSEYEFDFTVPEVSNLFLGRPAVLAFVLLLSPLADPPEEDAGAVVAEGDGGLWPPHQRFMTMRVLSRAFVNPFDGASGGLASQHSIHTILLGCEYVPVCVRLALVCQSVTCPLSNDRMLLNLNITNVSRFPVTLHSASLDVYSTTVVPASAGKGSKGKPEDQQQPGRNRGAMLELWAEQRAGACGSDMRTVDILTKIVTVTPMIVSDDRPPFTLHADETYSFQFAIEVLPELCYLLNPKSLQYVYAKYAKGGAEKQQQQHQQPRTNTTATASSSNAETAITDCYGEPVSSAEIVSVLSCAHLTYLFVYFDLGVGGSDARGRRRHGDHSSVKADGLHLRHAAKWSFGV